MAVVRRLEFLKFKLLLVRVVKRSILHHRTKLRKHGQTVTEML